MSKIVLIEDNNNVRENIKEILELDGYEIFTADNGKAGVELVKTSMPDLVICDIMMPELDGFGVLKILNRNAETADIPFIFLTAKNTIHDQRKGMNLGADDFLTKPFTDLDLIEAVETRLKRINTFKNQNQGVNERQSYNKPFQLEKHIKEHWDYHEFIASSTILKSHAQANQVFYIEKGIVRKESRHSSGKKFILDFIPKRHFLNLSLAISNEESHFDLVCDTDVIVYSLNRRDFLELLQKNPQFASIVNQSISKDLQNKECRTLELAYSTVKKRIISALVKIQEIYPNQDGFIKISRKNIANYAATNKETAIRTLKDLEEDQYIQTSHHGFFINNLRYLKKILNESSY